MKKLMIFIIGFLVLILAVIFASPIFLNKYKDEILAKAGKFVDREITMGDLRLTLFTGLGLRLTDVTVSNGKGFQEKAMLAMDGLDVKVKFLPLLGKKIQVDRIILRSPQILIEKNAKGLFNFSDLTGEEKPSAPPPEEEKIKEEDQAVPGMLAGLLVSKIEITDGALSYYDAASEALKNGFFIKNLDLGIEDVSLDKAIPLSLSFGVNQEEEDIKLKGSIGPVGKELNIDNMPISLQMAIPGFSLQRLMAFLGEKPPVSMDSGTLKMTTDLSGDLGSGLQIKGTLNLNALSMSDPSTKEEMVKGLNLSLSQDLTLRLKEDKVTIQKADLTLDRAVLHATGEITDLQKEPALSIQLTSNEIPLAGWDKISPALSGITLDGSIQAKGNLSGRPAKKIFVTLDLTSPNMVVSFPEKSAQAEMKEEGFAFRIISSAEAAKSSPSKSTTEGPALPENIDIKGRIEIAKGIIDDIAFTDLKGNYAKAGNQLRLSGLTVKAFGDQGSATANMQADLGKSTPTYNGEIQLSQIDLSKLQESFAARSEKMVGHLTATVKISGAGFDVETMKKNLSGQGNFKVDQGKLTNVNLEKHILSALSQKTGIPATTLAQELRMDIAEGNETPFEDFFGTFSIQDSNVQVKDLTLTSKNHGFATSGRMGFDQILKLEARMILRQIGDDQQKKFNYYLVDEKKRKYIPFKVSGNTSKPSVKVDVDALFKEQARKVVDEKKEELKDKLKEKLGPEGEELLKPLEKIFKF